MQVEFKGGWKKAAWVVMGASLVMSPCAHGQIAPAPKDSRPTAPVAEPGQPASAPLVVSRKPGEPPLVEVPFTPLEKVEIRGTGTSPIILIAPYGMDWRLWETFMERNASRYKMYAITLPGFAGTTAPSAMPLGGFYADGAWTLNAERGIVKLIEDEKLDAPFVIGEGYGGHLAIRMVMMQPDKVSGAMSLNGPATVELPGQSNPRMPREQREDFVARTMRAAERVSDEDFFARQKVGIQGAIRDSARGEFIASMVDGGNKATFLQYLCEFYSADLWPRIGNLKKPIAVLVPMVGDQAAANKVPKETWRRWFQAARRNCDVVYFEKCMPLITEDAPQELDRSVHAFVHGKYVPGKSRFASPLEKYIAPEEGGPAEIDRLPEAPPEGEPAAPVAVPAPEGDGPKEPAPAPAGSPSPK